jgi:hypothetical protein
MKRFVAVVLVSLFLLGLIISCNVLNNDNKNETADGYYKIEVPMIQTGDLNK